MRKLSWKEDWPTIPYMIAVLLTVFVPILDFIFIQNLVFKFNIWFIIGLILVIPTTILRLYPRKVLVDAGFPSITSTARLQIVDNHKLVKNGLYKHIRHPLYLGEIFRTLIFPLIFSSLIAILFSVIAIIFLLFRIRIEERMLLEEFGEEYEEYKRNTKKLIPYIY